MKKLLNKKNNKGFSLVELIVVVLIMGIIAVALAPQVMKWVGTARENSDENVSKDIKNAVQIALTDWQQTETLPGSGATNAKYTINGSFTINQDWGTTTLLSDVIKTTMGDETPKPQKAGSSGYVVEIEATTGKVTISY